MAVYDFGLCNVYLVEDNAYVRTILAGVLRRFKFARVETAANGAEAIEYFKTRNEERQRDTAQDFDIVICDLVMAPVNGLLFLRWLRTDKESTNRFVPFIMVSGAADPDYVRAASDLGVTEFLAKPFSATSVYEKILHLIDYPRQFVATKEYFGPDRRRRDAAAIEKERRQIEEGRATVVYSTDKVYKPKDGADVWYFKLPNTLKEKTAGLGAAGPGELPVELLAEAEAELERATPDFTDWAQEYLSQLSDLCAKALGKPGRRTKQFEEINLLAHELRGQGGTFGYPLITVFAKMLYDVTGKGCRDDDNAVEIVKAHIDAMRAVIRDKIAGDGGDTGRALTETLETAVQRLSAAA